MILKSVFFKDCGFLKLLLAYILLSLLTVSTLAQTTFTQGQFSRLSVLTRAGFFEDEILRAAKREGIDPNILWTIAYNETRFRPYLTSPKNARGLMQFIPATAARFGLADPYEPRAAIHAASRYIKVLSAAFGGRLDSILAAYNAGEGTVNAFLTGQTLRDGRKIINPLKLRTTGGIPPYSETVGYVGRGLRIYAWLIRRGTFPANFAKTRFPSIISARVAGIRVTDAELGKAPDFNNLTGQPRTGPDLPTKDGSKVESNSALNDLPEVYYETRTGNRYRVLNGNLTKLADNGIILIDNINRPLTTNKARSTFFAASKR